MTAAADLPTISTDELRLRIERAEVLLVDVLPRESFESAHIAGALSLPLAELPDRTLELLPDREATIVVYCAKET